MSTSPSAAAASPRSVSTTASTIPRPLSGSRTASTVSSGKYDISFMGLLGKSVWGSCLFYDELNKNFSSERKKGGRRFLVPGMSHSKYSLPRHKVRCVLAISNYQVLQKNASTFHNEGFTKGECFRITIVEKMFLMMLAFLFSMHHSGHGGGRRRRGKVFQQGFSSFSQTTISTTVVCSPLFPGVWTSSILLETVRDICPKWLSSNGRLCPGCSSSTDS